jgi:phosphoglycerate dehydrogenase-like enzyme
VTALLVSDRFRTRYGDAIIADASARGLDLELLVLPADPDARLADDVAVRAEVAYFSSDVFPHFGKPFFSATRKAPALKWLHVFNAGVDHPVFASVLERGVRLTTSSGTAAAPIAQTAIAGMLYLSRNVAGQTLLVYGYGKIGAEIARLARLLGMRVIGVRRNAAASEHADEMHTPEKLHALLARSDWLVLACPLTAETRGVIDATALAAMPKGARVINISRGEVIDEPTLIAALGSGHLGGAYLDVFAQEPLPKESPLWDLPNVLVTAHDASTSDAYDRRINALFLDNLARWQHNEPLINEVTQL